VHKYTPGELRFIKSKIAGRSYTEVVELFNRRFGLSVTAGSLAGAVNYYGLGSNGRLHKYTPKEIRFLEGKSPGGATPN
jgi:hypothetical protein